MIGITSTTDYDGDRMIGGYDQVNGGFRAFNDGLIC